MSALVPLCIAVFTALWWLAQHLFFGGWILTRWIAWLTWPIWASVVAFGALAGALSVQ